ncbi:hypothetical protein O181_041733 [Austropuccinia psidii MF-1]|uniref:Uncharacterized protein n=1 Tax=Austropuccinia psidii MF-1 TaxID=1389203 RepID=A0A9Q3DJR6_9BASI|nr:hypothetical protein [Austropuccinia psidii MF-1]
MSHTYAPAPATSQAPAHTYATAQAPTHAHATAQAPAPAHATAQAPSPSTRGSTCFTHKRSIPLDIRRSHSMPLCASVTPMHPLHCEVGSSHVNHPF